MKKILLPIFFLILTTACSSDEDKPGHDPSGEDQMYFPANNSEVWETKTPAEFGWNQNAIPPLLSYLEIKHSKSFIILVNGKIVMENYFNGHSAATPWYWASAGKTLTSAVTGIAQQEGLLDINNKVSDYIGTGWTSAPVDKENLITCRHLLTMTSGLDDAGGDSTTPEDLHYLADAGTRWAYDNVYVKLQDVVAAASGQTWNSYFNTKLRDKTGMTGTWLNSGSEDELSVYWSTTRSMARFGLLALNWGTWNGTQIVNKDYFKTVTIPSQQINKSYGYLWWINGQESYHMPQTQVQFPGSLLPDGPKDMFMALGKNDQKIYVIPSRKMVIIRMGEAADEENWALSDFDNALWEKINAVIN
ncbi:serine hydrolase [Flavobacterium sp. DG1-102-2]|uniref:serine hydrolase domain-containing protein n=1 Tax=Flavobacterium sp. DG1-102-2 TaxID=3081663 RepID=UPI002949DBDC|nr:serine hydrolase [Flavobacterium sp. DG1-102-2]MDV6168458.1 serine hydrolase [Flavobacterium sp. DG1-102-2]